jgi:hypothetical protein
MQLTVIDAESPDRPSVTIDPSAPGAERAFGWERKPEGLCRDEMCVPVPDGPLDLAGFAKALHRPLVIDERAGVAAIGASSMERGAALHSGMAPDFTLKDLAGEEWTLSQFRGRKVVLYAYASW